MKIEIGAQKPENFRVDSRCGLHCTDCLWKESQGCGGCIETQGHPFHGACPIAACCQSREVTHCGECDSIPCNRLYTYSYLDPEHGDRPPGDRVSVCRHWAAQSGKRKWRNVLLTAAGFEDMAGRQKVNIVNRFLAMLHQPVAEARVLFIPTAAIDDAAKDMAEWCRRELIGVGIDTENITDYDLDGSLTEAAAMEFDVIYFTGGNTGHLLQRIKDTGFEAIIKKMVYANRDYVGVSAGSLIATPNIGNPLDERTAGLALVQAYLSVHQAPGTPPRTDLGLPHFSLSDNQALAVHWNGYELIEN